MIEPKGIYLADIAIRIKTGKRIEVYYFKNQTTKVPHPREFPSVVDRIVARNGELRCKEQDMMVCIDFKKLISYAI